MLTILETQPKKVAEAERMRSRQQRTELYSYGVQRGLHMGVCPFIVMSSIVTNALLQSMLITEHWPSGEGGRAAKLTGGSCVLEMEIIMTEEAVKKAYNKYADVLGKWKKPMYENIADPAWFEDGADEAQCIDNMKHMIAQADQEIRQLLSYNSPFEKEMMQVYLDTFSPERARAEHERLMGTVTANSYQKLAMATLNPKLKDKDVLINSVMGLCGESGEVIDIVKKWLSQGHELDKEKLKLELGDVAWYLAEAATALDMKLEDVFQANLDKLAKRYPDGFDSKRSTERKAEE